MNLPRIMVGMPIGGGSLPWPTALSLMTAVRLCDREKIPVRLSTPVGSSVVSWARDFVVGEFLRSDCTHLFWIDADIVFTPNDFFRIVGFGAVHDIIGATYPLKRDPPVCVVNIPGKPGEYEVNGHGNVRITSMAQGFTICKREVIEKIAATKLMLNDEIAGVSYPDFFRFGRRPDGGPIGEDVGFFQDAAEQGFTAWLDPSINLQHIGPKAYTGNVINMLGLQDFAQEKQE